MQPNFALSLSFDGIKLMHRVKGGWHLVGEVPLDAADLDAEIAVLRRNALALEPRGLRTKILIPNEQIRYLSLDSTRAQDLDVRQALDGATPYAIDELVYDFARGGGRTHIAAVARETLDEAETFANGYRFSPVCFAAIPEEYTFPGEVFFGQTTVAHKILGATETAERDETAVRVIGRASIAALRDEPASGVKAPEPVVEAKALPEIAADVADQETAKPETDSTPVADKGDDKAATDAAKTPDADEPAPEAEQSVADAAKAAVEGKEADDASKTDPAADDVTLAENAGEPDASKGDNAAEPAAEPAAGSTKVETKESDPPPAKDAAAPDAVATDTTAADTKTTDAPEKDSAAAEAATKEATAGDKAPDQGSNLDEAKDVVFASRARPDSVKGAVFPPPKPSLPSTIDPVVADKADATPPLFARRSAGAAKADIPEPSRLSAGLTPMAPVEDVGKDAAFRRLGGAVADPEVKSTKAKAPTPSLTPKKADRPKAEAPAKDAAKPAKRDGVRGKPRYLGLILTGLLVLFLLLVALFAAKNPDSAVSQLFGFGTPTTVAEAPSGDVSTIPIDAAPAQAAEAGTGADTTETTTAATTAADPEIQIGAPVSEAEAERIYTATRVWVRDPRSPVVPRSEGFDAAALPSPHNPIATADAPLALAVNGSADVGLPAPLDPLPAGTSFERDARGFILATAEGTRLPSGIMVKATLPPIVPPTRPGDPAPASVDATTDAATATDAAVAAALAPEAEATAPLPDIPTVVRVRPPLRPEIAPEAAPEPQPAADLGEPGIAVAAIRPLPRPAGAAPTVDTAAIADALAEALPVTEALRPEERPADMAAIVAAAAPEPAPEPAPTTQAAYQAPQGPTPGGVAQAATVDNAIALREVSLVAIMGTSSSRSALVRLANGRIQKVVVGDRLDNGTVTAISATQLIYQKRGQNIVLEMPEG